MMLCLLDVGDDGTQWIQGTFFLDHKSFPAIYCLEKIFKKSSFKKTILTQQFFSIQLLPIDVGNDMGTRFSPYWRVYWFQRTNTFNNQHNIPLGRRAPSALSLHTFWFCVDNTLWRFMLPIKIYLFTKTYGFREYKLSKILDFFDSFSSYRCRK